MLARMRGATVEGCNIIFFLGIFVVLRSSVCEGVADRTFSRGRKQAYKSDQTYTPSIYAKTSVSTHVCSYLIQEDGSKERVACRKAIFCKKRERQGKAGKKIMEEWLVERRQIVERGKMAKSEEALVRLCSSTGNQEKGRNQKIEPVGFCGTVPGNHLIEDSGDCTKYFSCQKVYNGTWRIQKGMWPGYYFLERVSGGKRSRPGARWEWEVYHFMCRRGWSFDGVRCRKGSCRQEGLSGKEKIDHEDKEVNSFQSSKKLSEKRLEVTTEIEKSLTDKDLKISRTAEKDNTSTELPKQVQYKLTTEYSFAKNLRDFVPIFNENIKIQNNVNRNVITEYVEGEDVINEKYEASGSENNVDEDFGDQIVIYEGSDKKTIFDDNRSKRKDEKTSIQSSKIAKRFRGLTGVKGSLVQNYGPTKTILLYRATPTHAQGSTYYY